MLPRVSIASILTLLALVSNNPLPAYGEKIYCITNAFLGLTKQLKDCPIFLSEKWDPNLYEMSKHVLVCCPVLRVPVKSTPPMPMQIKFPNNPNRITPSTFDPNVPGSLTQAMCTENAKIIQELLYRNHTLLNKCDVDMQNPSKLANLKQFPHMATIGFESKDDVVWQCSGTLISSKIVLTTAVCTYSTTFGFAKWVKLGVVNLWSNDETTQIIRIQQIIRNPHYQEPLKYHDIAILRLEHNVMYNEYVRPACLPLSPPSQTTAITVGFNNNYGDELTGNLIQTMLNIISQKTCEHSYPAEYMYNKYPQGIVADWLICAQEPFSSGTFETDGSLVVPNSNYSCAHDVIGIVNWSRFYDKTPGVYTQVYTYVDWIEKTAWPEFFESI